MDFVFAHLHVGLFLHTWDFPDICWFSSVSPGEQHSSPHNYSASGVCTTCSCGPCSAWNQRRNFLPAQSALFHLQEKTTCRNFRFNFINSLVHNKKNRQMSFFAINKLTNDLPKSFQPLLHLQDWRLWALCGVRLVSRYQKMTWWADMCDENRSSYHGYCFLLLVTAHGE